MTKKPKSLKTYVDPESPSSNMSEEELDEFFGLNSQGFHNSFFENVHEMCITGSCKYRDDYGVLLIHHMSKGRSLKSFAGILGVTYGTVMHWQKQFSDFRACVEIGKSINRLEWEKVIHGNARGTIKGNAAAVIFALKNYFPDEFKDKREIEQKGTILIVDTGIKRGNKLLPQDAVDAIECEYTSSSDEEEDNDLL